MVALLKAKDALRQSLVLNFALRPLIVSSGVADSFYQVEAPLTPVLAQMEHRGIGFRPSVLTSMSEKLDVECDAIEKKVR